jgi:DNA-binding transcriptional ArsR family regulator
MTEIRDLANDKIYLIFQALSHPTRIKILTLVARHELTFSSLKHELGMESSGQLQHHLQKLSGLIEETGSSSYSLTSMGERALGIYRESERSSTPLAELCCLPSRSELAYDKQVSKTGSLIRLSIGLPLSVITVGIIGSHIFPSQTYLNMFDIFGGASVWGAIVDVIVFGFFGISFLISSLTGYPGCEITAIPNLFTNEKRYCSCLIIPFNVPNARFLQRGRKS